MTRLLSKYLLGIWVCLGLALISSCATHRNAGGRNASPAPASTLASTIGSSVGKTPTVTRVMRASQHTVSPIPTSAVGLATPEVATVASDIPTSPLSTSTAGSSEYLSIPVYTYEIINTYPHDPDAFTQGLAYVGGVLYEGTGLRGRSTLRRVDLETGDILKLHPLSLDLFGEGVTVLDDKIYQLTWKAQVGFVYDKNSFALLQKFAYATEGWGLTHDGHHLIMSDGTSTLHFLDPGTLEEIGRVEVFDNNGPLTNLNELEYVRGEIYANVWKTDRIARIDPQTGRVTGWIELTGLLSEEDRGQRPVDVLNGVAYDAENDRLFVTGKWWPKLFEIKLVPGTADVD